LLSYANNTKYNTKEDHTPLHNSLFENSGINFDLVTYGDMPRDVVDVFEKYCKKIKDITSLLAEKEYDPPILGKSYIAKYNVGSGMNMGYDTTRPENVFTTYVVWNSNFDGGKIKFKNYKIAVDLQPGDCIIFPENEEYQREITHINKGSMLISQFWNAPVGQSPYPGLKYEEIYWGNPLWENR
jgi:hypothetical protein